jgi:hypothetical protein
MTIPTIQRALLPIAASLLLLAAPAFAQSANAEVPFNVLSAGNMRFQQPLQLVGPRAPAKYAVTSAFMVRVEVSAAAYDALPPSMEPRLYIGGRELRTYSTERPPGGKTVLVTFFLPGGADVATFDANAPMVITIEHGRPAREPGAYQGRRDLKTFRREWTNRR